MHPTRHEPQRAQHAIVDNPTLFLCHPGLVVFWHSIFHGIKSSPAFRTRKGRRGSKKRSRQSTPVGILEYSSRNTPVLLWQYSSTAPRVLEYCRESTAVLSAKYSNFHLIPRNNRIFSVRKSTSNLLRSSSSECFFNRHSPQEVHSIETQKINLIHPRAEFEKHREDFSQHRE